MVDSDVKDARLSSTQPILFLFESKDKEELDNYTVIDSLPKGNQLKHPLKSNIKSSYIPESSPLNIPLTQSLYIPSSKTKGRSTIRIVERLKKEELTTSWLSDGMENPLDSVLKSIIVPNQSLSLIPEEFYNANQNIQAIVENSISYIRSEGRVNKIGSLNVLPHVPDLNEYPNTKWKRELQLFEDFLVIGGDVSELPEEITENEVLKPILMWQYANFDSHNE